MANVKKMALKYRVGPNGQQRSTDDTERSGEIPGEELAPEEGLIEIEDKEGNNLVLAYTQCAYKIAQEGDPEAKKVFINI